MSIVVECMRTECGATADIGTEADWTTPTIPLQDPFADFHGDEEDSYGDTVVIALPHGWVVEYVVGDAVIHCPDHAGEDK